jgi:hypothetical protein
VLVDPLALSGAQQLHVDGGAVIRQFLAGNLIDDMLMSLIATPLDRGISLFGAAFPEQRLVLGSIEAYATGCPTSIRAVDEQVIIARILFRIPHTRTGLSGSGSTDVDGVSGVVVSPGSSQVERHAPRSSV